MSQVKMTPSEAQVIYDMVSMFFSAKVTNIAGYSWQLQAYVKHIDWYVSRKYSQVPL